MYLPDKERTKDIVSGIFNLGQIAICVLIEVGVIVIFVKVLIKITLHD